MWLTLHTHNKNERVNINQMEKDIDSVLLKYNNEPGVSIGIIINDSLAIQKHCGQTNLKFGMLINVYFMKNYLITTAAELQERFVSAPDAAVRNYQAMPRNTNTARLF